MDKFLWAMRLYKTRNLAAEAIEKHQATINDSPAKASRMVKVGEEISVRKGIITNRYKVLSLTDKRLSAPLVKDFLEDITPREELEKLEMAKYAGFAVRDRGAGRPTKKDRREIEDFLDIM